MSNEHITDEQIMAMAMKAGFGPIFTASSIDRLRSLVEQAATLRPSAQPAATHIGSLNTREQIFQNGYRIGFKAGQQTVTAAPAAPHVAVPAEQWETSPMGGEQWQAVPFTPSVEKKP